MTSRSRHLAQYEDFKKGAELDANPPQLRVEAIFLAIFHLIDACAASHNVHVNKHQRVRYELARSPAISGERRRSGSRFKTSSHAYDRSSCTERIGQRRTSTPCSRKRCASSESVRRSSCESHEV